MVLYFSSSRALASLANSSISLKRTKKKIKRLCTGSDHTGRLCPKGCLFQASGIGKGRGFTIEVYEKEGKPVIKGPIRLTGAFKKKSGKRSGFVRDLFIF